ncbi:MAG: redox-regulated ATPase YchF [Thermoplasmata archaeon]|nr:MAG: redox-regulated ATPase YchF [Thermoplasmata archaeon]
MEIGIVGKPNVGKSTFFNACTLAKVEVASYPFTTIEPNRGVTYVRVPCPCRELGVKCSPKNSMCIKGNRFIPVDIIDVAGLVPEAHSGRGLGNKFLDELRQAKVLIHVVDASGGTDFEGNFIGIGKHSPKNDVEFLEKEIEEWFFGIFERNWEKIVRKCQYEGKDFVKYFASLFAGLGFNEIIVAEAIRRSELKLKEVHSWKEEEKKKFIGYLRKISKPMIIAANKSDVEIASKFIEELRRVRENVIPVSAMGEYLLRKLASEDKIEYIPGDREFKIKGKLKEEERKALEIIKKKVFGRFGSTGVQECINKSIFGILRKKVVYPVEDENKFSDKQGNVLPDAFLMDWEATPRDLAFKIHTEIGENFIGAIDARTKRKIPSDKPLENGAIVKILTR